MVAPLLLAKDTERHGGVGADASKPPPPPDTAVPPPAISAAPASDVWIIESMLVLRGNPPRGIPMRLQRIQELISLPHRCVHNMRDFPRCVRPSDWA